ncbi:MAG TPA: hypothetical protein VEW46_09530 [Pyrinomonadaceae bacterium]|nr:hypothetical protein [Pyrinomonadaceae bacterium]
MVLNRNAVASIECEEAGRYNRVAVENLIAWLSQGSRQSAATLGYKPKPRWGKEKARCEGIVWH